MRYEPFEVFTRQGILLINLHIGKKWGKKRKEGVVITSFWLIREERNAWK